MAESNEVSVKQKVPTPAGNAVALLENMLIIDSNNDVISGDFKTPKRIGTVIVGVVFGVFGLWSAVAPISGAVHAPAQVTVKSFKKPVQHLEGGIVKEVLVREGDRVQAGDVLVVLDNTQSLSSLGILTTQLKSKLALEARLVAQRDQLEQVVYPSELQLDDAVSQQEISAQSRIFAARKTATAGEIAILQQRVEQLESRISGLEAMRHSKLQLAGSYQEELEDVQSLLAEGFADKNRLRELERSHTITTAEAADLAANIATTKIQIGENRQEILQLTNRLQAEVVTQLSQVQTELQDTRERIVALTDVVSRSEIRSPDSGVINNLKVHTPDSIIPASSIIAEIVPQDDALVVEARVSPMDIDRIGVGQEARVNMISLNGRIVPTLYGVVTTLSADAIADQSGAMFYLARLELTPESVEDLGEQPFMPGMPADVAISTGSYTFFEYLMRPITDFMGRALREN